MKCNLLKKLAIMGLTGMLMLGSALTVYASEPVSPTDPVGGDQGGDQDDDIGGGYEFVVLDEASGTHWSMQYTKEGTDEYVYRGVCVNVSGFKTDAELEKALKEAIASTSKLDYDGFSIYMYMNEESTTHVSIEALKIISGLGKPYVSACYTDTKKEISTTIRFWGDVTNVTKPIELKNIVTKDSDQKVLTKLKAFDGKAYTITAAKQELKLFSVVYEDNNVQPTDKEENYNKFSYRYNPIDDCFETISDGYVEYYQFNNEENSGFRTLIAADYDGFYGGTYLVTDKELPKTLLSTSKPEVKKVYNSENKDFAKDLAKDLEDAKKAGNDLVFDLVDKDGEPVAEVPANALEVYKAAGMTFKTIDPDSGAEWIIESIDKAVAFDRRIEIGAKVEAVDNLLAKGKLPETTKTLTLDFKHSGDLPGTAKIKMAVPNMPDVEEGYVYYFNTKTNLFDKVGTVKIVDEMCYVSISHCSDYVITTEKLPAAITSDNPSTGDNTSIMIYMLLLVCGLGIAGATLYLKKKNA